MNIRDNIVRSSSSLSYLMIDSATSLLFANIANSRAFISFTSTRPIFASLFKRKSTASTWPEKQKVVIVFSTQIVEYKFRYMAIE